jgi:hypothetical protein
MIVDWYAYTTVIFGLFVAFSMYSCLYGKSNPLYAFAEQTFIGIATGMNVVMTGQYIYRTGIQGAQAGDIALIIGLALGVMLLFRLVPRWTHYARLPIALTMGAQLGLTLRTQIFAGFIDQITGTIRPLLSGDMRALMVNWVIAISVITMLTFFLYTIEIKGALSYTSLIGEYFMYIGFGVVFAQTFMGRLGLLVGYFQDSFTPDWKIPITLGLAVGVLGIVILLDKMKVSEKWTPVS